MKPNKSIDGLKVRSSKTPAIDFLPTKSSNSSKMPSFSKKATKVEKAPKKEAPKKVEKVPEKTQKVAPEEDLLKTTVLEDSIEITVDEEEPVSKKTSTKKTAAEDFLAPLEAFNLGDDEEKDDKKDDDKEKDTKMTKEESEKPEKSGKTKKDSKKRVSKTRKIITSILLIIVLLIIAGITWVVLWGNDIIAKITGGQDNIFGAIGTLMSDTYEPLKTDSNGRTNILAFGTSGYNMAGDEGNGVHAGAQLTDSIMMISLNQETGDIAMLSLPRDLKASPTCTSTGKINEVYWCNGGGGKATTEEETKAANALMAEVGSILGVDFQYYAHLNWGSLIQIVDILGGITVKLDEDILDYYWTGAVFEAGKEYTINGEQALGLARARHGTMGGDFSRGTSQQKILIGIKNKIFEKEFSINDLIGLANTLGDNLRTNFSLSEIKTLAHLTDEFDLESMRQITLYDPANRIYYMTTGMINGISYVLPSAGVGSYGAIKDYVSVNLSNDPRDYEEPTILILNATDTAGLAATEQATLTEKGFKNIAVGDAPEGEYPEGTSFYALTDKKPGSKSLLLIYYDAVTENLPENVSHDYDFVIILNPKTEEETNN